MGALPKVNGGVGQGQWGLVRVNGGIEKDQCGHWSRSMGVLKRVKGALVRVNGGIEKGQWGALVRVNAGIEKGQWRRWSGFRVKGGIEQRGLNGGIEKDQCRGALVRVNWGY